MANQRQRKRQRRSKRDRTPGRIALVLLVFAAGAALRYINPAVSDDPPQLNALLEEIPAYSGSTYVEVNGSVPGVTDFLSGVAYANICRELMPTEKREDIHMVKPTGWHSSRYDSVDGGSLYNRSHLIAFQLAGENANEKNLITGTRYMNAEGMIPFENLVADYVKETGNHVLYRVTPVFQGTELVARGVQMEAMSVEDHGAGVSYATGDNWAEEQGAA